MGSRSSLVLSCVSLCITATRHTSCNSVLYLPLQLVWQRERYSMLLALPLHPYQALWLIALSRRLLHLSHVITLWTSALSTDAARHVSTPEFSRRSDTGTAHNSPLKPQRPASNFLLPRRPRFHSDQRCCCVLPLFTCVGTYIRVCVRGRSTE